jgi:hypothetical protein
MAIGDINISDLRIGDINLNDPSLVSYSGFNVYEDILNPYGPVCEIRVVDFNDVLGITKLNGDYNKDVVINFSVADTGQSIGFKFKMFQNKNLDDKALQHHGSGHSKQYDIRGVSSEMLAAQGNFVEKSYDDLTSNIVKDILTNNFKTDKSVDIQETTKGKRRLTFNNEHPLSVVKKLNGEHVASQSESSAYVLYQETEENNQKYVFSTFEKLFQQEPVATLKQSTTLNTSMSGIEDQMNSIMWIKVSDSFFTPTRPMSKSSEQTVNLTTHGVTSTRTNKTDFKVADGSTASRGVYVNQASYANQYPVYGVLDKANDKQSHETTLAKKKRAEYISHLSQNSAQLEIPGNAAIKIGKIINLIIPQKADFSSGGETQFNGKALVTKIRHKIKPIGQSPRYTMILEVVKASYKEGGGNA